jgi:hypothetical protein
MSLFAKISGNDQKDDSDDGLIQSDSEEIEPPKYIESARLANSVKFYEVDFTMREIKKIYRRIINPSDP